MSQVPARSVRRGLILLLILLVIVSAVASADEGRPADDQPEVPLIYYEDPDENPVLRMEETPDGTIVDLLPSQDTFVTSGQPNTVWGNSTDLLVGYDLDTGRGAERIYFQFDIGYIPGNIIIHSATLHSFLSAASPPGDNAMPVEMRHLNGPWSSSNLTWANATAPWGGVAYTAEVNTSLGWRTIDVTGLVRDWVSGTRPNYGMLIQGDERIQERERGFFSRNSTTGNQPFLRVDYTYSTDVTAPTAQMIPFGSPWTANSSFSVFWTGQDEPGGSGIAHFDVEFRVPGGDWQTWLYHTNVSTAVFTGEDNFYEFRVQSTDNANNVSPWSTPVGITVDTAPPDSRITPFSVPITANPTWLVQWSGTDGAGSGIASYQVQVKVGQQPWQVWISSTTNTSQSYTATAGDNSYLFEVRATDNLGNAEQFTNVSEAGIILDAVAPFVEPLLWLPMVFRTAP